MQRPSVPGSVTVGRTLVIVESVLWLVAGLAAGGFGALVTATSPANINHRLQQIGYSGTLTNAQIAHLGVTLIVLGAIMVVAALVGIWAGAAMGRLTSGPRTTAIVLGCVGLVIGIGLALNGAHVSSTAQTGFAVRDTPIPGIVIVVVNLLIVWTLAFNGTTRAAFRGLPAPAYPMTAPADVSAAPVLTYTPRPAESGAVEILTYAPPPAPPSAPPEAPFVEGAEALADEGAFPPPPPPPPPLEPEDEYQFQLLSEAPVRVRPELPPYIPPDAEDFGAAAGEAAETEVEPVEGVEGEPVEGVEGEPVEGVEGEPAEEVEGQPAQGVEGQPVEGVEGQLVEGVEGQLVEGVEGQPVEGVEGQPVEGVEGELVEPAGPPPPPADFPADVELDAVGGYPPPPPPPPPPDMEEDELAVGAPVDYPPPPPPPAP
jgi:hypothetical protein